MTATSPAGLALCATWIVAAALCQSPALAQTLRIVTPVASVEFTLEQLKARIPSHTVTSHTPSYGKDKKFDAFSLLDVLALASAPPVSDRSVLLFKAADLYMPHMPTKNVSREAFIAYQDHGSAGSFESLVNHGKSLDPGPYYLVWTDIAKGELEWPYQLVEIEIVPDPVTRFANLAPKAAENSKAMRGFDLFQKECMKCHAINHIGGGVGPELNVPKNVTEYFDDGDVRRFIHNPQAMRAGSKMPAFAHLGDEDIRSLVIYLKAMKNRKVLAAP